MFNMETTPKRDNHTYKKCFTKHERKREEVIKSDFDAGTKIQHISSCKLQRERLKCLQLFQPVKYGAQGKSNTKTNSWETNFMENVYIKVKFY